MSAQSTPLTEFDHQVRMFVYTLTMQRGYPPLVQEAAQELHTDPGQIQQAYRNLAKGRILFVASLRLLPQRGDVNQPVFLDRPYLKKWGGTLLTEWNYSAIESRCHP